MESNATGEAPSFWARLKLACRLLFNVELATQVNRAIGFDTAAPGQLDSKVAGRDLLSERAHDSGLFVLAALQREGRLIDFLQQDVTGFSDEEVGAAARVVHAGCSRVLKEYFEFQPAVAGAEGTPMTVPQAFDAQRIRLTGNVTGQPPFKGTLKHHGWVAKEVRLPSLAEGLDMRVVAPAEVELP